MKISEFTTVVAQAGDQVPLVRGTQNVRADASTVAALAPAPAAASVPYNNAVSGIPSATVQGALDNLDSRVDVLQAAPAPTAAGVSYNNAVSGIPATNVQGALDNLDSRVDALQAAPPGTGGGAFGMAYDFQWQNSDTSVSPGFGVVRVNNTSFSLATELSISFAEKGIFVADLWIAQIKLNDVLLMMNTDGTKRFVMLRAAGPAVLQSGGQWYKVPLAQVQAGGQWSAGVVYEMRVGRI